MLDIKKSNVLIALFLVIILLLSVIVVPGGQYIPISSSMETKKVEGDALSSDGAEINAINVDVQVKKLNGVEDWAYETKVNVCDIISFKITVTNIVSYDLVNIQLVNMLPSPDFLLYINGSGTINGEIIEPELTENNEGFFLIWKIEQLLTGELIEVTFNMVAIAETTTEGITINAIVRSVLDPKYEDELISLRNLLKIRKEELLQITQQLDIDKATLLKLYDEIEKYKAEEASISQEIDQIIDQLNINYQKKTELETFIKKANETIIALNWDKAVKEQKLKDIKLAINDYQQLYNDTTKYIAEQKTFLDLKEKELIVLNEKLRDAYNTSADQSDTIKFLLEQIYITEGEIQLYEKNIQALESEQLAISGVIADLKNQEELTVQDISTIDDKIKSTNTEKELLEAQYDQVKLDEKNLIILKNAKQAEHQDTLDKIANKQLLLAIYVEEIGDLRNKEKLITDELTALDLQIADKQQQQQDLKLLIDGKEQDIIALSADKAAKEQILYDIQQKIKDEEQKLLNQDLYIQDQKGILAIYEQELSDLYIQLKKEYEKLENQSQVIDDLLSKIAAKEEESDLQKQAIDAAKLEKQTLEEDINLLKTQEQLTIQDIALLDDKIKSAQADKELLVSQQTAVKLETDNLVLLKNAKQTEHQDALDKISDKQLLLDSYIKDIIDLEKQELLIAEQILASELQLLDKKKQQSDVESLMLNKDLEIQILIGDKAAKEQTLYDIQQKIKDEEQKLLNQDLYIQDQKGILAIYEQELSDLYIQLNDAYQNLSHQDEYISIILKEISDTEENILQLKLKIDAAEQVKLGIVGDLDLLKTQEQQLILDIGVIDEQIALKKQEQEGLATLIADLDVAISSLGTNIMNKKVEQQDIIGKIVEKELILAGVLVDVNNSKAQELVLIDKIALTVEQIDIKTSEKEAYESDYEAVKLEIGSLNVAKTGKEADLGDIRLQIGDYEQFLLDKDAEILGYKTVLEKQKQEFIELYDLLDIAYQNHQVESTEIENLQNRVALKEGELKITKDAIDAAELEKQGIEDDLNLLRTDEQLTIQEIEQIDVELGIKTQEKTGYESDLQLVVETIQLKEQEKQDVNLKYQQTLENLSIYTDDYNATQLELDGIKLEISEKKAFMDKEIEDIIMLQAQIDLEAEELRAMEERLSTLIESPAGHEQEIEELKVDIADKRALVDQLSKTMDEKEQIIQDTIVEIHGLEINQNQTEQELAGIAEKISAKELEKADYEAQLGDIEADILFNNGLKADYELKIGQVTGEIDTINGSKALKEQYLENVRFQIANKDQLLQDKSQEILGLRDVLAAQELELSGLHAQLAQAYEDLYIQDEYITSLLNNTYAKEYDIQLQEETIAAAELERQGIVDDLDLLKAQEQQLILDISTIDEQIALKEQNEKELGDLILAREGEINALTMDKATYERQLSDVRIQITEKQGLADGLKTEIELLKADEVSIAEDIKTLETEKNLKISEKEAAELQYAAVEQDILVLTDDKLLKTVEKQDVQGKIAQEEEALQNQTKYITDLEAPLALEQQHLSDLYEILNSAYQDQQGENGTIAELQGKVDQKEGQITLQKELIAAGELERESIAQSLNDYKAQEQLTIQDINAVDDQIQLANTEKEALAAEYDGIGLAILDLEDQIAAKKQEQLVINDQKTEKQGLVAALEEDIAQLTEYEAALAGELIQIDEQISINNQKEFELDSNIKAKDDEIKAFMLDKGGKELTLVNIQLEIDEKQRLLQDKTNYILEKETLYELALLELSGLYELLNQAYLDQQGENDVIVDLQDRIKQKEEERDLQKGLIAAAELEKVTIAQNLNDYKIKEQLTIQDISVVDGKIKIAQDEKELLDSEYAAVALENESLIALYTSKTQEKDAISAQIAEKEGLSAAVKLEIDGLIAEEKRLADELAALDVQIADKQQQQQDLKLLIDGKEQDIIALSADKIAKEQSLSDIRIKINDSQLVYEKNSILLTDEKAALDLKQKRLAELKEDLAQVYKNSSIQNETIDALLEQIRITENEIGTCKEAILRAEGEQIAISDGLSDLREQEEIVIGEILLIDTAVEQNSTFKKQYEADLKIVNDDILYYKSELTLSSERLEAVVLQKQNALKQYAVVEDRIASYESQLPGLKDEILFLSISIQTIEQAIQSLKFDNVGSATIYIIGLTSELASSLVVEKKVWNETEWAEETAVYVDDTVRFNLTIMNTLDAPIIEIIVVDILPFNILEYAGNAIPYKPSIAPDLIWEIGQLDPGEIFYIEFDALAIAEGFGVNELHAKGLVNLGYLIPDDSVYANPPYHAVGDSDNANVTVIGNNPPLANDDYLTVDEDSSGNLIDVLANDSDPDAGDIISLDSIEIDPDNGIAYISDEQIAYTPNSDFAGSDSLTYKISDNHGATATAQVFITVNNINNPPVAIDDKFSTNENTPADFDVTFNDYDVDGDEVTLESIKNEPDNGEASIISGNIRYVPDNGFVGSDSLEYKIVDGNGGYDTAILIINVNNVNDPPVANDDSFTVQLNSSDNTIDVIENDIDPDEDALNIDSIILPPENGTAAINVSLNRIQYTPKKGFIGTDYFEYKITDGKGGYDTATVTINVVKSVSSTIVKPRKDFLYLRNWELFRIARLLQFIDADALIIGPITVEVEIDDPEFEAEEVEFYIDNELKNTTSERPYNWTFNERFLRICTIKVVSYGTALGKEITVYDEIDVLILNFGLSGNNNNKSTKLRNR